MNSLVEERAADLEGLALGCLAEVESVDKSAASQLRDIFEKVFKENSDLQKELEGALQKLEEFSLSLEEILANHKSPEEVQAKIASIVALTRKKFLEREQKMVEQSREVHLKFMEASRQLNELEEFSQLSDWLTKIEEIFGSGFRASIILSEDFEQHFPEEEIEKVKFYPESKISLISRALPQFDSSDPSFCYLGGTRIFNEVDILGANFNRAGSCAVCPMIQRQTGNHVGLMAFESRDRHHYSPEDESNYLQAFIVNTTSSLVNLKTINEKEIRICELSETIKELQLLIRSMTDGSAVERLKEQIKSLEEQKDKLERQVMLDGLTGILNRRGLDLRAPEVFSLARRKKCEVFGIMLDFDNFKPINDELGHAVGDEVLRKFASNISRILRAEDVFARLGGDEFFILAIDDDKNEVPQSFIDKIRVATEIAISDCCPALDVAKQKKWTNKILGCSIGAVVHEEGQSLEELKIAADKSLYVDKADREKKGLRKSR